MSNRLGEAFTSEGILAANCGCGKKGIVNNSDDLLIPPTINFEEEAKARDEERKKKEETFPERVHREKYGEEDEEALPPTPALNWAELARR